MFRNMFMKYMENRVAKIKAREKTKMLRHILKAVQYADPFDPDQRLFLVAVKNYRAIVESRRMNKKSQPIPAWTSITPNVSDEATLVDRSGNVIIN